jgi:hypothetical protein
MGTGGLGHLHFFELGPGRDVQDEAVLRGQESRGFLRLGRLLFHSSLCSWTGRPSLSVYFFMPETGIEPVREKLPWDFKSHASANSATPAYRENH